MILSDFGFYLLLCLLWVGIFIVFWSISGFLIYLFVDRKLRSCPNCKQRSAGKIIQTDIEPLGEVVDHRGRKSVRVKSERVTDHFVCQHCDHTWMRTFERKEQTPLDDKYKNQFTNR